MGLLTHPRGPSKPGIILKHGSGQENPCWLRLPGTAFTHTFSKNNKSYGSDTFSGLVWSGEGGKGYIPWSCKPRKQYKCNITQTSKETEMLRLDLTLFCTLKLHKGNRGFPPAKTYRVAYDNYRRHGLRHTSSIRICLSPARPCTVVEHGRQRAWILLLPWSVIPWTVTAKALDAAFLFLGLSFWFIKWR